MAFCPAVGGRIVKKLRTSGVRGTVAALFARLRKELYSEESFIVMRKDLGQVVAGKRTTGVVVEPLERRYLPQLSQLNAERDAGDADARFLSYLDAGFHGFVAELEGKTIGYYWWVDASNAAEFPDLRDFGMGIELGPGEVYGSDFYLLEDYRKGRIAGEVLTQVEESLRDSGYSTIWGYVLCGNRPALWLHEMRGYERLWKHTRKRRVFFTRVSNDPNPSSYRGGKNGNR